MAVSATTSPLTGLSRRLVQDGIVDEEAVLIAIKTARKMKIGLVPYLVNEGVPLERFIPTHVGNADQ